MKVQPINNDNPNFKAIVGLKTKGKDFKRNPELVQKIFEKILPNEKYNFPEKSVKAVIKSEDYKDFLTMMKYCGTEDFPYTNSVSVSFRENLNDNMFSKTWKQVKGFFTEICARTGMASESRNEAAPYFILGRGNSFEEAYEDTIHLLDIGATPSKTFLRRHYD